MLSETVQCVQAMCGISAKEFDGHPIRVRGKCALSTGGSVCVDICSHALDWASSIACCRVSVQAKLVTVGQLHVLQISKQVGEGQTGLRNSGIVQG